VYVHIPFCTRRCDYCAFATWTDRFALVESYVAACCRELERLVQEDMAPATSVFFGGGTPSLLPAEQISILLSHIPRAEGAEVTVECNPDTVDTEKLTGYRESGVTRLSFGVQSMDDAVLASLGRHHRVGSVLGAVSAAAVAGFEKSYSVDLIFGGAGESLESWRRTLSSVIGLDPKPRHVSAYALSIEPGTPLARDPRRHPDEDDQAEKYELADAMLSAAGLQWYEISNWAAPGAECAHNQLYWEQGEYRGIGCAAHSHQVDKRSGSARRWWNVRTPERYIRHVQAGLSPEAAGEDIDPTSRQVEALELSLRTRRGVPTRALPGWEHDPALPSLVQPAERGRRLVLTRKGRLLANEVALRLHP
jgi:oxygen-independent coproporphyrinogen-3 oxidase